MFWQSRAAQMAYGIWYFMSFYVITLAIFIFCYWRILIAIRRQARVMVAHGATAGPSNATQTITHQIQTNVIKTMILISAFYAISDMPTNIYYLRLKDQGWQAKGVKISQGKTGQVDARQGKARQVMPRQKKLRQRKGSQRQGKTS